MITLFGQKLFYPVNNFTRPKKNAGTDFFRSDLSEHVSLFPQPLDIGQK